MVYGNYHGPEPEDDSTISLPRSDLYGYVLDHTDKDKEKR